MWADVDKRSAGLVSQLLSRSVYNVNPKALSLT
jgi:hypothetical protein